MLPLIPRSVLLHLFINTTSRCVEPCRARVGGALSTLPSLKMAAFCCSTTKTNNSWRLASVAKQEI